MGYNFYKPNSQKQRNLNTHLFVRKLMDAELDLTECALAYSLAENVVADVLGPEVGGATCAKSAANLWVSWLGRGRPLVHLNLLSIRRFPIVARLPAMPACT